MHNSSKDALNLNIPIFGHMSIIGKEIKWKVYVVHFIRKYNCISHLGYRGLTTYILRAFIISFIFYIDFSLFTNSFEWVEKSPILNNFTRLKG